MSMQAMLRKGAASTLVMMAFAAASTAQAAPQVCGRGYIDKYWSETAAERLLIHIDTTGFLPPDSGMQLVNGMIEIKPDPSNAEQWQDKLATLKMAFLSRLPVRIVGPSTVCSMTSANASVLVCTKDSDCNF